MDEWIGWLDGFVGSGRRRHEIGRFLWGIPGTLLTLSAVGAPLGIPMLWRARQHQNRLGHEIASPVLAVSTDGVEGVFDVVVGRRPMLRGSRDWRAVEEAERDRHR